MYSWNGVDVAVVDADSHFWEPREIWDRYLEPALRERVAASLGRAGFDLHAGISEVRKAARQIRGGLDPDERLKWMDEEGIYATVIYPSEDTSASLIEEPEQTAKGNSIRTNGELIVKECNFRPFTGSVATFCESSDQNNDDADPILHRFYL